MTGNILIIDDDENILKSVSLTLKMHGYNILPSGPVGKYQSMISGKEDLIILDVYLGTLSGQEILKWVKIHHPDTPVIMISGLAGIDEAVRCVQEGAFSFLEKPLEPNNLLVTVQNALKMHQVEQNFTKTLIPVFNSPSLKRVIALAKRAAETDATVLITGPSGAGKDVLAKMIHNLSPRGKEAMIKINCGAIPEGLVESELFGHKKGSFTGAVSDQEGKISAAAGGTLFLDEIGELPQSAQVKFLRYLESKEIQRVGDSKIHNINARVICATNRSLHKMVEEKTFREDLFYRLNIIALEIPSLKERPEDIPGLINHFLTTICNDLGQPIPVLTPEANIFFQNYSFPGNVRELRNMIERLVILNPGDKIDQTAIDEILHINRTPKISDNSIFHKTLPWQDAKHELEKHYLETQLQKFNGSIKQTAEHLGILPNNLSRKLRILEEKDHS